VTDADSLSGRAARPENNGAADASGPKRRAPVRKRHTVAKVLSTTTLVLALAVAMSVAYAYRHLDGNIYADGSESLLEDRPAVLADEGPKGPLNILVMGSDSRDGKGNNIDGLTNGGARSDTTILLHISADRKRAYGISIPRDSMINRPECKLRNGDRLSAVDYVQWNAAFAIGGASCTMQQFEQITRVRLQHHVVVDFNGFKDMVDAIDGVKVCIPEPIDDPVGNIQIPAGNQVLKGNAALDYVRVRYVGNGSDIGRVKRQQAFIASMANKIISADTLARPDRLLRFLNAATKSLRTDKELASVTKLAQLGLQFQETGLKKIQFFTIPWGTDPANPNRIVWTPAAREIWRLIARDEPIPSRLKEGVIKADNPTGASPGPSSSPNSPSPTPSDEAAAQEAALNGLCA
jgi:LCP family protein required for cell wall assembly